MPATVIEHLDVARIVARQAFRRYRRLAEYDDLYQQACLGVIHATETFNAAQGASLRTWVITCARSRCMTYVQTPLARAKRGKFTVSLTEAVAARMGDDDPTTTQRREDAEHHVATMRRVRDAMVYLPARQRTAVEEMLSGVTPSDGARRRGLSRQAVAESGRRGVQRLRELLTGGSVGAVL